MDVIIGSDLTYDDENNVKLFETLNIMFNYNPNLILILAFTMFKETDDQFINNYKDIYSFELVSY